jgi:hypothetical protein
MKINELLVESQQLDEGPFTQAVGKVGGKIARGVANIGKDLKTGFKAGYSGQQPAAATPRDPDVPMNPTTGKPLSEPERAAHQAAGGKFDGETGDLIPLDKKAAAPTKQGVGGFIDQFKKGFTQAGGEQPAADKSAPAAAAADPKADAQSKVGVGQINKIIPTLRTRDLMSLKKNLDAVIAKKSAATPAPAAEQPATAPTAEPTAEKPKRTRKKAAPDQATIDADRDRLIGNFNDSIERHKQRMVAEGLANGTISIFKR